MHLYSQLPLDFSGVGIPCQPNSYDFCTGSLCPEESNHTCADPVIFILQTVTADYKSISFRETLSERAAQ